MKQYFDMLSWFTTSWPEWTKDKIFTASEGGRSGYAIAFQTVDLQVFTGILKGPKGGITSFLTIVDPSQPIEIDKLVCCDYCIRSGISSIISMVIYRDKKDFDDIVPKWLIAKMDEWKHTPELAKTEADIVGFGNTSIIALSGGLVSPR